MKAPDFGENSKFWLKIKFEWGLMKKRMDEDVLWTFILIDGIKFFIINCKYIMHMLCIS